MFSVIWPASAADTVKTRAGFANTGLDRMFLRDDMNALKIGNYHMSALKPSLSISLCLSLSLSISTCTCLYYRTVQALWETSGWPVINTVIFHRKQWKYRLIEFKFSCWVFLAFLMHSSVFFFCFFFVLFFYQSVSSNHGKATNQWLLSICTLQLAFAYWYLL